MLLAPLAREDVKTVRCLGLNYEQHAKEVTSPSNPRQRLKTSQLIPSPV